MIEYNSKCALNMQFHNQKARFFSSHPHFFLFHVISPSLWLYTTWLLSLPFPRLWEVKSMAYEIKFYIKHMNIARVSMSCERIPWMLSAWCMNYCMNYWRCFHVLSENILGKARILLLFKPSCQLFVKKLWNFSTGSIWQFLHCGPFIGVSICYLAL